MVKKILITGSTDGIGKGLAIKLAKEGHEVFIHGRNSEKLKLALSEIIVASENNNIKGFLADFSNLGAVQQMASEMVKQGVVLDVIINNAGIYKSAVSNNNEGLDIRMVVNYLAPYVLTKALMPLLNTMSECRIINLSSAAQSPVSLEALKGKEKRSEGEMYAQSKLALTMWSLDLAKRLTNINVIAVNPGSLLNTKMVKEAFGNHWSSADKGVEILYELAISPVYNGITGQYFDNDKGVFAKADNDAYNIEKINQLLSTTETILAK